MGRFRDSVQDRRQVLLLPPSLDEWVSQDDEVRLLDAAMEEMDWSVLESGYSELGRPAYNPRVLAKVLVYAYSKGVRSSRRIEGQSLRQQPLLSNRETQSGSKGSDPS